MSGYDWLAIGIIAIALVGVSVIAKVVETRRAWNPAVGQLDWEHGDSPAKSLVVLPKAAEVSGEIPKVVLYRGGPKPRARAVDLWDSVHNNSTRPPAVDYFAADPLGSHSLPSSVANEAMPEFWAAWDALLESAALTGVGVDVDAKWQNWDL